MSVLQLVVSLHVLCPHIKYVLIMNLMDSGREIKIPMSSLYISKLLGCITDSLFCVMNVLSFSMADTREKILLTWTSLVSSLR